MKKYIVAVLLATLMLCGCQAERETIALRIVDGAETGHLVLAGESAADVYTLNIEKVDVLLDDKKADASVLEDGMVAEVVYNGIIGESWPAQFGKVYEVRVYSLGSMQNPGGSFYDLCGLYLQVLNDLWDKDSGLNDGAEYVSVDLANAPGDLTSGEKTAIAWIFANEHGAIPLTLSMQELIDQGYLTELVITGSGLRFCGENRPKAYQWENGVYFSIVANPSDDMHYSLPVIFFNAWKWRSPLGAYFFSDCSAVWPQMGVWGSYNVGHEMIS